MIGSPLRPRARAPLRLLAALLLALWAAPALAADPQPVVMVLGYNYPPFFTSERGDPATLHGLFIDFLDAFEQAHPEFTIQRVMLPRRRKDLWMRTGQAQVCALNAPEFVVPEDRPLYRFTEPLWVTGDHLVVLASRRAELPDEPSLHGRRVGLMLGYGYSEYEKVIDRGLVEPVLLSRTSCQLRMLQAGRVDAIVANRHVLPCFLEQAGMTKRDIVFIEPPLYEFGLAMQVSRDQPALYEALNSFIREARQRGLLPAPESAHVPAAAEPPPGAAGP
ncbi:MAG: transporter substrate-binding domain-containing protein [Desulfovibrionaceae bacterium]